jgi:hypothetical protein
MIARHCIAAAGLLALAACGSSGSKSGGNGAASATSSGGGGAPGAAISLQPGEWEMTMEMLNVTAPGMPPAVAAQMKRRTTSRTCMSPEEAKGPKPDTFVPQQNGMNCKREDFAWGGGRIHGKTTCTGINGSGTIVTEMDGEYSAQSMDMTMKTDTKTSGVSMAAEMRLTGRRVGECTPGKEG